MRLHIEVDDRQVKEIDKLTGARGRSRFIRDLIASELDRQRRWALIRSAAGTIKATGHEWDPDPADWVHRQRRADSRRIG